MYTAYFEQHYSKQRTDRYETRNIIRNSSCRKTVLTGTQYLQLQHFNNKQIIEILKTDSTMFLITISKIC